MSNRRGILVKDGQVVNVVVWGDESAEQFARDGYEIAEEITDLPREDQPAIGWIVREEAGQRVFRTPKPFESWVEDGAHGWRAPVPEPDDGMIHEWDEDKKVWNSFEPPAPPDPAVEFIAQLNTLVEQAPDEETKAAVETLRDGELAKLESRAPGLAEQVRPTPPARQP